MLDRNKRIDDNFVNAVNNNKFPAPLSHVPYQALSLSQSEWIDIFESQVLSRHLDLQSRLMQKQGNSFYTIGSAGHEGNAAYAKAFRVTDMAFLHYRSGAFVLQRSKQADGQTPLYDMLLSFSASSEDPVSGGRHKVLGSKSLNIPPQTSTIASHVPKAVGAAYSVRLGHKVNPDESMPEDAVILCNFGDASANHSTAQGAINAACWASFQSIDIPMVFVCEDNGIGISTPTPKGWIKANFSQRPGLKYLECDGLNPFDTFAKASEAVEYARKSRKPVFLHFHTVRLLGHAGSDAEFKYRSNQQIDEIELQDPLLHTARELIQQGILSAKEVVHIYESAKRRVALVAENAAKRPRLDAPEAVIKSLIPPTKECQSKGQLSDETRTQLFKHEKHNLSKPQHLAKHINWALLDLMAEHDNIAVFGEDVGKKGGVYGVTSNLVDKFGASRVINTLLDEQSILGLAIGMAHNGILPIPEIQFLAYVHNAEDQIRGEAATLSFFSNGQYTNPMVIRIAGLAYQKGFGGHFHNDNSFAIFRDIPGLVIACPSNGEDAALMLRESVRLANEEQRVVVFLEPIALYMKKDLHEENDNLWSFPYPEPKSGKKLSLGEIAVSGSGKQLAIVSYGNGYYLSRQAQKVLQDKGFDVRVIDLRWLAPIPEASLLEALRDCENILVVDECRRTGSISEALITLFQENLTSEQLKHTSRITAEDSFIPLGSASYSVLPDTNGIIDHALNMLRETASPELSQKTEKGVSV
ncbi:MAG: MFS transporter [Alteromonadaceae bacterium]|nr:MFS transporter [Alteromonadaceae bacterium]